MSRSWLPALPPLIVLVLVVVAGFVLAGVGLTGFDQAGLLWFRLPADPAHLAGPGWLPTLFQDVSWLSDPVPRVAAPLVFAGLFALRGYWQRGLFFLWLVGSGGVFGEILKHLVARPRPEVVAHLVAAHGTSFPSGHALASTLIYVGVVVVLASLVHRRWWCWLLFVLAVCLALVTGISRVALGVHNPTDVIAGWVIGAAWLWFWCVLAHGWLVMSPCRCAADTSSPDRP